MKKETNKATVLVRLPRDLVKVIKVQADKDERSVTWMVRKLLADALSRI